jgi:hypothetical protein
MVVIRLLFLVFSLGLFNAFVLSWGIVDISQLYEIPYLKEFGFWNIVGLALLKGVLEGNTKIEVEKRKIEVKGEEVSEERVTKDIVVYFIGRMMMIATSVGIAHLIHWIYL